MRSSPTAPERDLFAFSDARIETAFVQHVGKHTRLSSEVLRGVRSAGWTVLVLRFLLQTPHGSSGACATAAIVLAVYLATCVEDMCMLRMLRKSPPVLHEYRKSYNVLLFMVGRMVVAVLMTPTDLPFTSASAIAMLTGIDMAADCVRLCVGLRMLALSCLACFCTLAGQVKGSALPLAFAVGGSALIIVGGFLLPAAALACLELRSRLVFIGLHPPGAEKQLAPRWHAIAAALKWPLPSVTERQQQQQQQQQHHQQQQQQQPDTAQQAVRTALELPHGSAQQPGTGRAPGRSQQAESPRSVLDTDN